MGEKADWQALLKERMVLSPPELCRVGVVVARSWCPGTDDVGAV